MPFFTHTATIDDGGLYRARTLALSALEELGPVARQGGRIVAGGVPLEGHCALVDHVQQVTGHGCTIFDRNVRIATTAVAAGGTGRALGTKANDDVTRQVFRLGQVFRGITFTIGKDWVIAYDPLRDGDGEIVGMLAVFRELAEFHDRLAALRTPEAVLRVRPDGTVCDVNPSACDHARTARRGMLGAPVSQWLGIDWSEVPPHDTELQALWAQPDGFRFVARVEARWLGESHLLVVRDYTAEARAQEALAEVNQALEEARRVAERANEGKSMFLANVSHELRTPLTAVLGYTQLLREEAPGHASDLERIESSATYLLALIDDLLDVTKARAGRLELDCKAVDLVPILFELGDVGRELAVANDNRFDCTVPVGAAWAWGDARRVRQVLYNLVSNACKFTKGGAVVVSLDIDADEVRVAVGDDGIGMDAVQVSELFTEFGQVHRSHRAELGGTGLGLALSQRLANAMGGHLSVQSTPGEGAFFQLHLPAARPV